MSATTEGTALVTGKAPITTSGIPAIVILEPRDPMAFPPPTITPALDQSSRIFIPPVLFARTGHPVEFRNSDEELHNINVKDGHTSVQSFNVVVATDGLYEHTFDRAGTYDVTCDVHAGMMAQIVVTSSPYATLADEVGEFLLRDVRHGSYEVIVYAGTVTVERAVEVASARVELDLTRP